ncbi:MULTISPECIES: acyl-CoA dehydrogenase family protein [unclassified Janthinobacterium]|uniref:acyl-CoA dehydrogenase family protein n=1 Tax=unclassified Janthinobacterium TaxID=2610881 RepID=UPI00034A3487|nr:MULTISPECIES: acyl-CoA dehydrogenase [unclassified Janthinobacterium]MEC5160278.1 alkylation response protein AidB-like acyl-CoA dehydrogenase [Janthinobacterium sp. CG_S6]
MDFTFKEEQRQFADALRRWVDKDYSFEARNKIIHSEAGVSDAAWATLAELGMTALPVPEAQGGFNGSAVDMLVVMQELGRGLVVEPYLATVLGAEFLRLGGGHDALLQQVAAGELKLACALGEKQARHDLFDIRTRATPSGEGYLLDGAKSVVLHGAQAGALIVSARSGGEQRDSAGISLFVVPADSAGVGVRDYRTIDGQRAASITFTQVWLPAASLLGAAGAGWDILDAAADYGATLLCAEAVGAMDAIFAATLEYLKTRTQFGAPIGKFQALQHRMADMFIHLEQARSMAMLAAGKVGSSDAEERRRTVSAAKVRVGQAAKFVGQQAVQLHGGIGVTNELPAAHHFKRLTMIELTLGDSDHHLERFIAQPGFKQTA